VFDGLSDATCTPYFLKNGNARLFKIKTKKQTIKNYNSPLPLGGRGMVPLRFAQIREYGMPLPLFNIEIRITAEGGPLARSRSGKGGR